MEEKERYKLEFKDSDFKRTSDWAKDIEVYMKQIVTSELEKVKELGFIQSYTLDVPNILILKYEDFNRILDDRICQLKSSSDDLIKGLTEQCEQLKQSQKQFAIEVLKELRFAFNESIGNGMLRNSVCFLIDEKIRELEGGKNEKSTE